ncbi:Signal transduction histidine kinase CheA (plasmid) [Rhodovastum atsumiense]|uniref:hybrid sensor histidine kinase/response regulator n=1 Tax=Rhodovastum atsumiense TaxID=504468 RepID=UPI002024EB6D|nr:hybrid sensor histidine kinase/response regulator [Rhodovastum atsumiense]CAH2605457.1 Signal transduction histidine kinase CheA [Rhodovastum atsumiense]
MDDFVKDFLVETVEALAVLDNDLVRLEATPDDGTLISGIFRTLHTIKGTCGFLGLQRLGRVAHAGENVLGRLRDGTLAPTPEIVTAILHCVDAIKALVANLEATGSEGDRDDETLIAELDAIAEHGLHGAAPETSAPPPPPPPPPPPEPAAEAPASDSDELQALFDAAPGPDDVASSSPPTPAPSVAPPPPPAPPPAPAASRPAASPAARKPGEETETRDSALAAQSIRVSIDLLETLMTTVSELVLTRNQLLQLLRNTRDSEFAAPLQRLSLITSELQEGVMKTRMQPIGNAWSKLPRIVRDLARELGKKIELVMDGADTEVDRQILELIKDPLTHMVRNCADHGLENPQQRVAAGKEETGRVHLQAFHEGGHIIVRIADDGRGMDIGRIRRKAVENGLTSEAELLTMSDAQILQFIFRAGFSTAEVITAVSGRGVGMDVVKTNIEKIGGTIDLASTPGRGAVFTIKIPLTLAIVSALIVGCGIERFAVPQISVIELVRAGGGDHRIERIKDSAVLRLRERLLPLVDLRHLLELGEPAEEAEELVVVTQVGPHRFGIVVDRIYDTEEIVVKPVAPLLKSIGVFSGNTILGDGSVCMILDPNGILSRIGRADAGAPPAETERRDTGPGGVGERMRLLLVRAGGGMRKAIPLDLVARLEEIAVDDVRSSDGRLLVPYRERLMPLVLAADDVTMAPGMRKPVLVFTETDPGDARRNESNPRQMGLIVDAIEDIVESTLTVEIRAGRPDIVGSALVGGEPTEVVDTGHHLTRASADWFSLPENTKVARRVLMVDDSGFFRNLIVATLRANGIEAIAASNAEEALTMISEGPPIDLLVTDIDMPGLSGYELARRVRNDPRLANIPIIGLSGHASPRDVERGMQAGFTRHLPKLDRDQLMATISNILAVEAVS